MQRFRDTFSGNPSVRVMSREEICQQFRVQDDERHRDVTLSRLCEKLRAEQEQTGLSHCLLVDELTPKTGDCTSACDWSGLDTWGIICILCIQPTSPSWSPTWKPTKNPLALTLPPSLNLLILERVFRCTHKILNLLSHILQKMDQLIKPSFPLSHVPGHEVTGDLPEVLLLPRCPCTGPWCTIPQAHLLQATWASIMSLLIRVHREGVQVKDMLLMLSPGNQDAECLAWAKGEIAGNTDMRDLRVRSADLFRGSEAEVVIWCCRGEWCSSILDACSRATSRLLLISQPDGSSILHGALEEACRLGKARLAVEQASFPMNPH